MTSTISIPSPSGKESWCKRTIDEILSNEKYVGDVLLMKRIRLSVGSKRIKNHGEQEQYRIEGNHPPIITREAFDAVQQEKVRRTNIDKSDNTARRKSTRYKSKFSISMYEFKDWE
ncbi:MAG: recombinase family protein [Clostridia bacterium]|nr:recombinase family protein [Clostridia bacterium]